MGKTGRNRKISFISLRVNNQTVKEWFYKQGGTIRTWKKRLFILNENILFYYKTEFDKEPKGIINLKNANIKVCNAEETAKAGKRPPKENNNSSYYSVVITTNNRTFWLCNSDADIVRRWGKILSGAANLENRQHISKTGWLMKSGGKVKTWKLRYFVLKNDVLSYYKPKNKNDSSNTTTTTTTTNNNYSSNNNSFKLFEKLKTLDERLEEMTAQGTISLISATVHFKQNIFKLKKKKSIINAKDLLLEINNEEESTNENNNGHRDSCSSSSDSLSNNTYSSNNNGSKRLSVNLNAMNGGVNSNLDAQVVFDDDFQKTCFPLVIQNNIRSYLIYAKTQDDCDEWVCFIFESILNLMSELVKPLTIGDSLKYQQMMLTSSEEDTYDNSTSYSLPTESSLAMTPSSLISPRQFESCNSGSTSATDQSYNNIPQSLDSNAGLLLDDNNSFQIGNHLKDYYDTFKDEIEKLKSTLPLYDSGLLTSTISTEIIRRSDDEQHYFKMKKKKKDGIGMLPKGSYNDKCLGMIENQSILTKVIPIKLMLLPGVYTESGTININQPIELEGLSPDECIIEVVSSNFCEPLIRITSENVRLKRLTLRLIYDLPNEQLELRNTYKDRRFSETNTNSKKDFKVPCVISVESGSVFIDECNIILQDNSLYTNTPTEDETGDSACIYTTGTSECFIVGSKLQNADYGIYTSGNSTSICLSGQVSSRITAFYNLGEGSCRNYNVLLTSVGKKIL
ncbi:hypothetical protein ABK040_002999 [Willaertia magna]